MDDIRALFADGEEKIKIHVDDSMCGAGKTQRALSRLATVPCRAVFVTDRIEVMGSRMVALSSMAAKVGCSPAIIPVHSKLSDDRRAESNSVKSMIEKHANMNAVMNDHVILLVTHESMKTVDWNLFEGWDEIVVDEAPSIFDTGDLCTSGSVAWWRQNFALTPVGDSGWSMLAPSTEFVGLDAIAADEGLYPLALTMSRRATDGRLFGLLKDWDRTIVPFSRWQWLSIWSPMDLNSFRRVTILASQFNSTMTSILMKRFFGDRVQFVSDATVDHRVWQRRTVVVKYFVNDRAGGSTVYWAKEEGRGALLSIAKWLCANTPDEHIFAANNAIKDLFFMVPGKQLTPRQAGSNEYSGIHCATMIYSNKVTPTERSIMSKIGVTAEEVRRAREYEDIIQFVYRLSIRDPNSTAPVEIRLYDRGQAEFVAEFLAATGYCDVAVEAIEDAGVFTVERPSVKLVERYTTDELERLIEERRKTKADKQREYREKKRAELLAMGGTVRKRGRPKKAA